MEELCRTASSLSGEPHGLELSFKKVFITKIRTNVSKDNLPFQERNTKQLYCHQVCLFPAVNSQKKKHISHRGSQEGSRAVFSISR